jgi:2-keto-4-pentenoate hydratase/2-oxohepta-3-ene-1,7-dioic acid hydratase in catechol pathway
MKLISFRSHRRSSYGILRGSDVVDLGVLLGDRAPSLRALLALPDWRELADSFAEAEASLQLAQVELLAVIPDTRIVICVGHNYEEHRIETQRDPTQHPSIFFRHAESVIGSGAPIIRPRESSQLDYEGELAIVIGRGGRRIEEADAWDHVAGVACLNDGSVRDWQHHTRQFTPGKNFAQTGSVGPALVTLDELPADRVLDLTTRVNGNVVQRARTDQMIFPIPTLIAYVSTFMTLEPGDLIATGTPGGVGVKRTPPLWLQPGDLVEVEISSVGRLVNTVVQEA